MADTHTGIPTRPQPHLSACTTSELTGYEAALRSVLLAPPSAAVRREAEAELDEVREEWEDRDRITPGHAGRVWPITNSM